MFENIRDFLADHVAHLWLEHLLFYIILVGAGVIIFLIVKLIIKSLKYDKESDLEKRRRDKRILKFLSDKKNKTF